MNVATGRRSTKWSFRGSPAGIAVSPDGSRESMEEDFLRSFFQ